MQPWPYVQIPWADMEDDDTDEEAHWSHGHCNNHGHLMKEIWLLDRRFCPVYTGILAKHVN